MGDYKMNKKQLKEMIKQVILENRKKSVLLETPQLHEATFAKAADYIDNKKLPFFIVSAFRGERGTKYSRKNISAAGDVKDFLKSKGLSYTIVDGGYTEKKRDKITKEPLKNPETGDPVYSVEEEESYLVFGDVPHYGDTSAAVTDVQELFEIAKEACLIDPENPQETFSFGYPVDIIEPGSKEPVREMRIALYENDAPSYAREHMFTEWGGPWNSFAKMMSDVGAYTKIRGTKGAFAEEKLEEARNMKVNSVMDGYKKQHYVDYWTKMKARWDHENKKRS
tara:strand:+ start:7705 stop:8547 length:843 start_codon:yes stop_codon:yes gene_type:complete